MQENNGKLISRLKVELDGASEQEEKLRAEQEVCQKDMLSKYKDLDNQLSQRKKQFEDSEQELKHLKGLVDHIIQDKDKVILEMQISQKEYFEKEGDLQNAEQEIAKMFQERDKRDKEFNECQMQMSDMQNVINKMVNENNYLSREADSSLKSKDIISQLVSEFDCEKSLEWIVHQSTKLYEVLYCQGREGDKMKDTRSKSKESLATVIEISEIENQHIEMEADMPKYFKAAALQRDTAIQLEESTEVPPLEDFPEFSKMVEEQILLTDACDSEEDKN
ncbi:meiosis-specific nuclear structural protein 1-like [Ambystoma mexicanum]|uniref:meiosis-specific nuclear structural protein 1-like n=1 Tax=Ambystoma mexicanum TaxID=8296 RepID=UPI0037E70BF9